MPSKWGAMTMLVCLAASSCSGDSNGSTAERVDDDETTLARTPVTFNLPPVDEKTAIATLEAIERAELGLWIESAQIALDAADPLCDPGAIMLTSDEFDAVVTLADEVTGELLANLDASLGAAAEWCLRNDFSAAQIELNDARTTAQILAQRLKELD